ncbi:hypothetical protein TNCV_1403861 [Trichonephila clavipes]|nr:hypothetical protein TNCV_1403861 [Trichonephila clavipes]
MAVTFDRSRGCINATVVKLLEGGLAYDTCEHAGATSIGGVSSMEAPNLIFLKQPVSPMNINGYTNWLASLTEQQGSFAEFADSLLYMESGTVGYSRLFQ